MKNGLCFGCLRHGHMSKNCTGKSVCKICQRRHPTSLHTEQKPNDGRQEAVCNKVMKAGKGTMSAMIVPVWISAKDNPETEHLVYALLDTQSDTTFVLEETANALNSRYETAKLQLSTMSARDNLIICKRFKELEIRSFDKNVTIDLPDTYSRDFIPTDRSHIPTSSAADKWPHLRRISHLIPPMQKCEVGLLIGWVQLSSRTGSKKLHYRARKSTICHSDRSRMEHGRRHGPARRLRSCRSVPQNRREGHPRTTTAVDK